MSKARQLADLGNQVDDGAITGSNIIINGAANVQQRSAGTIVTSGSIYGPDRFKFSTANMDNIAGTFTQDSDAPEGFGNSIKVTITTAESAIAADEYAYISQLVEAQNLQQLAYGTSAAKQLTLSFWVKSSITGTFAAGLYKPDNTAQIHNLTYTINSASTWEYKTLTFAANTLSGGAVNNDNGEGFYVNWHLAAGSGYKGGGSTSGWSSYASNKWADGQATDAVITTTNATFYLTGVCLNVGDSAIAFPHESYGDTLAKCQRFYYQKQQVGRRGGGVFTKNQNRNQGRLYLPQVMRASPSFTATRSYGDGIFASASITANNGYTNAIQPEYVDVEIDVDIESGGGNGGTWEFDFYFNAEL